MAFEVSSIWVGGELHAETGAGHVCGRLALYEAPSSGSLSQPWRRARSVGDRMVPHSIQRPSSASHQSVVLCGCRCVASERVAAEAKDVRVIIASECTAATRWMMWCRHQSQATDLGEVRQPGNERKTARSLVVGQGKQCPRALSASMRPGYPSGH